MEHVVLQKLIRGSLEVTSFRFNLLIIDHIVNYCLSAIFGDTLRLLTGFFFGNRLVFILKSSEN